MLTLTATAKLISKYVDRIGIHTFGEDNLYPQNTQLLAENSPSLSTCIKIYKKFIFGNGVEDRDFWKKEVNIYGLRVDQLLRRVIDDYSKHHAYAVNVIYNGLGEKIGIIPLKFENIRLGKADDYGKIKKLAYFDNWGGKYIKKDKIIWYDAYNSDLDVIWKQAERAGGFEKWRGQIFYYGKNGELEYPQNSFHSEIENAATDSKIKEGKNANVSTNFMGSHLLQLPFTYQEIADQMSKRDNKISATEVETKFKDSFSSFQGSDNTGKLMVIENGFKDADGKMRKIELQKFELQNYDKLNEYTEKSVNESIRRNYLIPPILTQEVSAGFSTELFNDAYNYYNQITNYDRQIFEELMLEIFSGEHELKKLDYVNL